MAGLFFVSVLFSSIDHKWCMCCMWPSYWHICISISELRMPVSLSFQLWVLWELVMIGEPVLVLAPNVGISSAIIMGMVGIKELQFHMAALWCKCVVFTHYYLNFLLLGELGIATVLQR